MRVQRVDPGDSLTRDGLTLNLYDRQLVLLSVLGAEVSQTRYAATERPDSVVCPLLPVGALTMPVPRV